MLTAMKILGVALALVVPGGLIVLAAMFLPQFARKFRRLRPAPAYPSRRR